MANSQAAFSTVKVLRFIAIAGTLLAALGNFFSADELQPNQHYSFYALIFVVAGVCLSLLVFLREATAKLLKNPDLLVPVGLAVTAGYVLQFMIQASTFIGFRDRSFNFADLTVALVFAWILQIFVAVAFSGWTTRLILQLIEHGKVDLIAALQDFRQWFPRTFAVILFGWLPLYLLLAVFILPVMTGGGWTITGFIYLFMILIGAGALIWNLATAVLLPFVLSTRTNLKQAIVDGIRLGWKNKYKTALPTIALMILSGWIVVISVHYTERSPEEAAFGESFSGSTSEKRKFNFSTNFVWTGDYAEESKWHKSLLEAVGATPLPTVNFRIMLLMLLLSVIVKVAIVGAVWRREEITVEPSKIAWSGGNNRFGLAALIFTAICLLPFELILNNFRAVSLFSAQSNKAPETPGVIKGENLLKKESFFAAGQGNTVDSPQKGDEGKFEIRGINDIAVGDLDGNAGQDVVLATGKGALVLDAGGTIIKEIPYEVEKVEANDSNTYFYKQKIVDVDNDGVCEFVGYDGWQIAKGIYNQSGKLVLRFKEGDSKDDAIVLAAGDLDNDGVSELFNVSGGEIKPFSYSPPDGEINAVFVETYTVFDETGDGNLELFTNPEQPLIRDAEGKTIKKVSKPFLPDGFLIEAGNKPLSMYFGGNFLGLFDFEGKLQAKYAAPFSEEDFGYFESSESVSYSLKKVSVFSAQAARVRLSAGSPEFLAVIANQSRKSYSFTAMLYIYDSEGELIYQELLEDTLPKMFVMPSKNEGAAERLLISDNNKIWRYTAQ
jgi:hypothetical protein